MMNTQRRFGMMSRGASAALCALVTLFGLAVTAEAADAAHARPRHGVQSAGVADARGKLQPTAAVIAPRVHARRGGELLR